MPALCLDAESEDEEMSVNAEPHLHFYYLWNSQAGALVFMLDGSSSRSAAENRWPRFHQQILDSSPLVLHHQEMSEPFIAFIRKTHRQLSWLVGGRFVPMDFRAESRQRSKVNSSINNDSKDIEWSDYSCWLVGCTYFQRAANLHPTASHPFNTAVHSPL